ncbi:LOW QUALITY PROTEIN: 1-acyl-sn-glycerol-3-phosphate acyltransferase epsilon-like [Macrobrachium nipponense]|uniref:LOW QUALITY PROTEIN: 1-acyl-sn-glycerol-3-phosphate acyltransferase epsilon-like n=1 Tax=Macrobrachium nipponense TaxID=159736 RepID=UPI0030C81EC8
MSVVQMMERYCKVLEAHVDLFLKSVRYALGSVIMFGMAPEYFGLWLVWRGVSLMLPGWMFQWGDDKLYSLYQRLVLFFFETCTRLEVVLYGDAYDVLKKRESVLYLGNHQSTVDWIVADMVSLRCGSLGHLRYVMKDTLQLIPLYGFYFYVHGCIYVKRGKFSQQKMIASLDYLKNPKIPTWLVVFPEGTRYYPGHPKVIEKSEKYARDNNIQVLKHHLVPKTRGTWLVTKILHAIDAIYDVSAFYEGSVNEEGIRGNAPQLIGMLMGKCKKIHIHIRRIPMSEVPKDEEELKVWLHNLYIKKDELAENFFTKDKEARASVQTRLGGRPHSLGLWSTLSSFLVFTAITVPVLCTKIGRQLYLQLLVYGTLGGYGWLALRSVC